MPARRSIVLAAALCACATIGAACRSPTTPDYLASLPDLPADLASTLDPATLATRVTTTFPHPVAEPQQTAVPCCGGTDVKALKVSYAYTKCAPLRDFVVADLDDTRVLFRGRPESTRIYRLRELNQTALDDVVCMNSTGPWAATLTEQRHCGGYTPVQTLVIDAYGDLVQFAWSGAPANHPPTSAWSAADRWPRPAWRAAGCPTAPARRARARRRTPATAACSGEAVSPSPPRGHRAGRFRTAAPRPG